MPHDSILIPDRCCTWGYNFRLEILCTKKCDRIFYRLLSLQSCVWEVWYPSDSFQPTPPHPLVLLRNNCHAALYQFKAYRMMVWIYIWWNDHHHRFSYFIVYRNQYTKKKRKKKKNLSSLWRTLRLTLLTTSLKVTPQGSLPAVMPNVTSLALSHLTVGSLCLWTIFLLQFLLSSSSSPGHCKSDLFSLLRVFLFCCLFVYRFHE